MDYAKLIKQFKEDKRDDVLIIKNANVDFDPSLIDYSNNLEWIITNSSHKFFEYKANPFGAKFNIEIAYLEYDFDQSNKPDGTHTGPQTIAITYCIKHSPTLKNVIFEHNGRRYNVEQGDVTIFDDSYEHGIVDYDGYGKRQILVAS